MNGASELIVSLWVLPVTVFIIIPLVMLVIWTLVTLANSVINFRRKYHKPSLYPVSKPGRSTE